MPDGWRDRDGELPPDPWAGMAPPPPPPRAEDPPMARPRRSLWQHPGVWIAVLVLAGLLLIGALLENPSRAPRTPSPDAVTALTP
ncbi:MAG: hypothetical protein WEB03_04795 [Nitriliruptor sp.]|uniref:hypothetical protein n=1 Tax=Nitriliruptor sp. TaxID=2448056 RepID=UPI0034A09C82